MNPAESYAKGSVRFMGLDLMVAPGALVPREETELLGAAALAVLRGLTTAAPRVVDMCCGSGNLACAIARAFPAARLWACDIAEACVAVTGSNAARLGLSDRIQARRGDLFAAIEGLGLEGTIDAVVCNPPYISAKRLAGDRAHLLEHEPRAAFDGGPYGLDIHAGVLRQAAQFLRSGGSLLFEFGLGQERQVERLVRRTSGYSDFRLVADDAGRPRVAAATRA